MHFYERDVADAHIRVCPVPRSCFIKDHLEPCYDYPLNNTLSLHDFALVYAVLALGTTFVLFLSAALIQYSLFTGMTHYEKASNYREIAARYNLISQACIAASDFATSSSLCMINALLLCAVYYHWGEEPVCSHRGWILMGIAFRLAITVRNLDRGIHKSDKPSLF